jgi:predicted TIM-barrel fold metal-dependent hydrolase
MKAIDVHAHPSTAAFDRKRLWGSEMVEYISKYYGVEYKVKTDEEMAQDFKELDIKALLIGWDAESVSGYDTSDTNDEVARLMKKFPDVFIGGWAMIDPWKGNAAIKELERCIKKLGLMGLKFQQALQAFFPNDRRFYPLYEKCVELKIPVSFHTGTTGAGAGMPGGHGIRLKYTMPVYR